MYQLSCCEIASVDSHIPSLNSQLSFPSADLIWLVTLGHHKQFSSKMLTNEAQCEVLSPLNHMKKMRTRWHWTCTACCSFQNGAVVIGRFYAGISVWWNYSLIFICNMHVWSLFRKWFSNHSSKKKKKFAIIKPHLNISHCLTN